MFCKQLDTNVNNHYNLCHYVFGAKYENKSLLTVAQKRSELTFH